jgi:hypothetical protein
MKLRSLDPSTRVLLVICLLVAVGADLGCVQSGNFFGAAVWSVVAVCVGGALVVTRPSRIP